MTIQSVSTIALAIILSACAGSPAPEPYPCPVYAPEPECVLLWQRSPDTGVRFFYACPEGVEPPDTCEPAVLVDGLYECGAVAS